MKITIISVMFAATLVIAWCALYAVAQQQDQINTLRAKTRAHELHLFSLQERLAAFEDISIEITLVETLIERDVIGVREKKGQ